MFKAQALVLSIALSVAATGCGGSEDVENQGQLLTTHENRCPIVTETRTTAESDLLVANSVKARVTRPQTQAYIRQTLANQYRNIQQISQVVAKNTMSPIDSTGAQELRASAAATAASLKDVSGAALDQAYLDWQISRYEQALSTMESRWLKMATTPDLVAFLHQLQGMLAERLETARGVRQSLK